jgi:acyl-CoA thioesterase
MTTPAATASSNVAPQTSGHTLGNLLALRQRSSDTTVTFTAGEDWGQGRTLFGGLLSALSVAAMRDVFGSEWPLRALQTSFVGPVAFGRFDVKVHLLRQGKHVRQVQAHVVQTDEAGQEVIAGVLLAVFGNERESTLPLLTLHQPPVEKAPLDLPALPFIPGLTPNFTQHLDFRLAEGAYPFMGADSWNTRTHIQLKDATGVDPELLSIILADAGPTPALAQLKKPSPASSVSWALELRPVLGADTRAYWRMDKDALAAGAGYVNERTTLWTPDGQLAALGYQVVAVYG